MYNNDRCGESPGGLRAFYDLENTPV